MELRNIPLEAWVYTPKIALYEDAKWLVAIRDTRKIPKLINSLADNSKTVVVHLVLSRQVAHAYSGIQCTYNYDKDGSIFSENYVYNGLEWQVPATISFHGERSIR